MTKASVTSQRWNSDLMVLCQSTVLCTSCLLCILARIWPARWRIPAWKHQKKGQSTLLCTVCYCFLWNSSLSVARMQTGTAAHSLPVIPCFLFQKPLCWMCLWRDDRTLLSGWQCVIAEGRLSARASPGFFLKMPKAKHACNQSMKGNSWKPVWHTSLIWPNMRDRTWPVCTITNMEPQRRLFISPDTVSFFLISAPAHFSIPNAEFHINKTQIYKSLSSRFNWLFCRHLCCESLKPHDSSAKPLQWWDHHTQTDSPGKSAQAENSTTSWGQHARVQAQL